MGYDLTSESGDTLRFNGAGWALLLNVAEAYGWQPLGSLPPTDCSGDWDGTYDANEGQIVSREDAKNLADALTQAQNDPDRTAREKQISAEINKELMQVEIELFGEEAINPDEYPEIVCDAATLERFITFLRKGSFTIQ